MPTDMQIYAPQGLALAAPKAFVFLLPLGREQEVTVALARVGFSRAAGSIFWHRGIHCAMVLPLPLGAQAAVRSVQAGPSGYWGRYEVILVKFGLPGTPAGVPGTSLDDNSHAATAVRSWISTWLQGPTIHARLRLRPQSLITNALSYGLDARTFGHCHSHPRLLYEIIREEFGETGGERLGTRWSMLPRFYTTFTGANSPPLVFSTLGIAAYMMASRMPKVKLSRNKFLLSLYPEVQGRGIADEGALTYVYDSETTPADEPQGSTLTRDYEVWYDSDGEEIPELLDPSDSSDDEM